MNRRRSSGFPSVGGSSLLVIFAVLCLTIFALLSLSTAQAGSRLSSASAQAVSDYYLADHEAETILAQLRAGRCPEAVSESDGVYSFTCPISDTQTLEVSVRLEGETYTILRWQSVSTAEWIPDESLDLWGGSQP